MAHDSPPGDVPGTAAFLAGLAGSLCGALADNGGNLLVHVKLSADGYEVGTLPLEGHHPADVLVGAVAPPDWVALGVASRGRPHPLDGRRRALPEWSDVVVLVHREGDVVGRLRLGDTVVDEAPAYGLTLDCLQRAFGLPTAPPLVTTGARFTSAWLERVVLAARRLPAGLTWPAVVALHPAAQLLRDEDGVDTGAVVDLVAVASALERNCDWERLRWLVVEGSWQEPGIAPVAAAWFDAGSFSRLALTYARPVHLVLADVRRAAEPPIFRRCRAVVRQLGLCASDGARPQRGTAA